MRIRQLAYDYLLKASELCSKDLEAVRKAKEDYLQPVSPESLKTYFKMKKDGFDVIKNTEKEVELSLALQDINLLLSINTPNQ